MGGGTQASDVMLCWFKAMRKNAHKSPRSEVQANDQGKPKNDSTIIYIIPITSLYKYTDYCII